MNTKKTIQRTVVRRRRERGNALMEFGLVSLIMIPLFFGVIDFSRLFYYAAIAQGAARAGTQYAVFQKPNEANTTGIQSAATTDASNVPSVQNFTVTSSTFCVCASTTTQYSCSTISCGSSAVWGFSQVNTQLTFQTFFKYPFLPNSMTVTGQSIMRYE